jgi:hypothetical protein
VNLKFVSCGYLASRKYVQSIPLLSRYSWNRRPYSMSITTSTPPLWLARAFILSDVSTMPKPSTDFLRVKTEPVSDACRRLRPNGGKNLNRPNLAMFLVIGTPPELSREREHESMFRAFSPFYRPTLGMRCVETAERHTTIVDPAFFQKWTRDIGRGKSWHSKRYNHQSYFWEHHETTDASF